MINVLWVDDLILNKDGSYTDLCNSFINNAFDEGIAIKPYATYDEAYKELQRFPSKWLAIILDVRNDNAETGNENQDYLAMRIKIEALRTASNNSKEPYIFVFSADATTISDSKRYFIKDADLQSKEVYIKPLDINLLIEDIKKIADKSESYSIYKDHEEIMKAMEELGWSEENQSTVFNLIRLIERKNNFQNDSLYNDMRKLLESAIYSKLEKVGIMDSYKTNNSEKDTLNQKSVYIGKNNQVPVYIQRAFHSLTTITQNGSHKEEQGTLSVAINTEQGKAPYLLKSCLYDLLSIIYWEASL